MFNPRERIIKCSSVIEDDPGRKRPDQGSMIALHTHFRQLSLFLWFGKEISKALEGGRLLKSVPRPWYYLIRMLLGIRPKLLSEFFKFL